MPGGSQPHVVRSRGTVTIDVERCKGCELCIPACPPGVLSMSGAAETNRAGYRVPRLHPGCTGCAACVLVCPDFVVAAYRFDEPVLHDVADATRPEMSEMPRDE